MADPTGQVTLGGTGLRMEVGLCTLAGGTVEVPTKLIKLLFAAFTCTETPAAAIQPVCDLAITSHAVTVADAGSGDKILTYMFVGY